MPRQKLYIFGAIIFLAISLLAIFWFWSGFVQAEITNRYQSRASVIVIDRHGRPIATKRNNLGNIAKRAKGGNADLDSLILKKEDRWFFYHFGVNPYRMIRAGWSGLNGEGYPSSTITQQLAKIILQNENQRSWKNKLKETLYALAIEARFDKEKILSMYLDTIYFGNNIEGVESASEYYFQKSPANLDDNEILHLLASVNNPTNSPVYSDANEKKSMAIAGSLSIAYSPLNAPDKSLRESFAEKNNHQSYFELEKFTDGCKENCQLSTDNLLAEDVRQSLKKFIDLHRDKNVTNGAAVVFKLPENEILALVGSPDPSLDAYGYKINMTLSPRPIGSTIKPFIYLKGFDKGLRPYTLVSDQEYKYEIGSGYAFYPKNFDYKYRGLVDLGYGLSNSLNVPTVKVLEYVGVGDFNRFLTEDLLIKPLQPIENYQLGIALGGLETDLLGLSYLFTSLPNEGHLAPAKLDAIGRLVVSGSNVNLNQNKVIADKKYVALVNKILSDRLTGVEQFGLASDLNLTFDNYALKTGTSRDFHDSWIVGYTRDFLVGVWIGNSDNTPMDQVAGANGAAVVWADIMDRLYNSEYNRKRPLSLRDVENFMIDGKSRFGLRGDDLEKAKNLMSDKSLIVKPHAGDVYQLESDTTIFLESASEVIWKINSEEIGRGKQVYWKPKKTGSYIVEANDSEKKESVRIKIAE